MLKRINTGDINTVIIKFILNNKALILLIVAFIFSVIVTGGASVGAFNLTSLLRQIPAYSIMAVGLTVVFATGQMDMSAGSLLSLCTVMYATWSFRMPIPLAIVCVILLGGFVSMCTSSVLRAFNLNAFILTLAASQVIEGISGQITGGRNISGLSDATKFLGQSTITLPFVNMHLPVSFIVAVVVILLVAGILNYTRFGRHLLATGGNLEAAKLSGIKINLVRIMVFIMLGICAGITSVLLTGRLGMGSPGAGGSYTLDCIAAVIIGGTTMAGGRAKVGGSLFGVCLILVINNLLTLQGVSTYWTMVAKGMIIAVAIILDAVSETFFQAQSAKRVA